MNDEQPKSNGVMVIVSADQLHRIADRIKFNCPNLSVELQQIVASSVEETPAVGGELEVFLMVRNRELNSTWRLADKVAFDCAGTLPKYERMELIDRAHVGPLLAEIEQERDLRKSAELCEKAVWAEHDDLKTRIAELEAQLANKNN